MRSCPSCRGSSLEPAIYPTMGVCLSALECAACGALVLDEGLARSDEERTLIAEAIEMRKAFDTISRIKVGLASVRRHRVDDPGAAIPPIHGDALELIENGSKEGLRSPRGGSASGAAFSITPAESGTHRVSNGLSPSIVEDVCLAIGEAVAELHMSLGFLEAVIMRGESAKAVTDARSAARRIDGLIDGLKKRCGAAAKGEAPRATGWKR
jgi:hypothetical protein